MSKKRLVLLFGAMWLTMCTIFGVVNIHTLAQFYSVYNICFYMYKPDTQLTVKQAITYGIVSDTI